MQFSKCLLAAVAIVPCGVGFGALIPQSGGSVSASSQLTSGFQRDAIHAYDGSGLTGGSHNNIPDGYMWESHGDGGYGGADANPYYEVDLGAVYNVSSYHVWNYNEGGNVSRGVGAVNVYVSNTAPDAATIATNTITPTFSNVVFLPGTGSDGYLGQDIAGSFTGRYVFFQILSNQGDGSHFYGLSELQFSGSASTPEPTSIGLVGCGVLGILARRRRA